jgi:Subtilase family
MAEYKLRHLRIDRFKSEQTYSRPSQDFSGISSGRNRDAHGPKLTHELAAAFAAAHQLLTARDPQLQTGSAGVYLKVEGESDRSLPDLNWPSQDIRLGALRVDQSGAQIGVLFVPESAEEFLKAKVAEYTSESTSKNKPRHEDKFAPLESIAPATLESLWTDRRPLIANPNERFWWECWCGRLRTNNLLTAARRLDLRVSERRLHFPESDVIPIFASTNEMGRLLQNTDAIDELRQATDTPSFFTTTVRREQNEWVDDLLDRIRAPRSDSPVVCILDGGVASAHPLLATALNAADCLSLDPRWGVTDHDPGGHGTNMAGSVLYGDLTHPLVDQRTVALQFRLESVKFLPPPGFVATDPMSYGAITQTAIATAEVANPDRQRVYCMAVTNEDVSGERPSSWSAAIDQCCAGTMFGDEPNEEGDLPRRLVFVSAGNIPDHSNPDDIADIEEFPIEDPAQAWNSVCVGGFTDKSQIAEEDDLPGWTALAAAGDLSPYSRVSVDWSHSRTAMKPEIVFEAGNRAISPDAHELVAGVDSLSLLTTAREFLNQPLVTFWATSSATAQAAGMAADIMAELPDLWPETVRALMTHSAEWTPAMRERLDGCHGKKADCILLARHFGYGVPRLDRALASAQNDLALVSQAQIKPYRRERKLNDAGQSYLADPTFDEAHFYSLPWPRRALEALGNVEVRLKITLSYFIEPSPSQAAPVTPSLYQSYGLRFDMKRKEETESVFHKRINRLERGNEKLAPADPDTGWLFGSKSIVAGSLHCDVWEGPAVNLAARNAIAIYPVGGWWRYRAHLGRYDSIARYSLVISISAGEGADLYTEISQQIAVRVETTIPT